MKIFLTGVTGLVGSAFVTALVKQQPDVKIVCLSRGNNARSAAERVAACIREECKFEGCPEAAENVIAHLTVVEGDVVNFDPEAVSRLEAVRDCDTIFHCAADVNLGKDPTGRTYNINYGGTLKMLELARKLPVKAFHYVSTAYTAGRMVGRAYEKAHTDAFGFNNPYEESKYRAEMLVRNSGFPFTIYRPAIITGRRSDGRIRKPLAFYRIVEFVGKLKKHYCAKNHVDPMEVVDLGLHFHTAPVDRIFFVPIDFVCESITALFQLPVENRTYHVTGDSPVSTMQIKEAVSGILRVGGVTITADAEANGQDDKLTSRFLGDLLPYFSSEVVFDQTNIRAALGDKALDWQIGDRGLRMMIESYFEDFFSDVEWVQKLVKASRAERGE